MGALGSVVDLLLFYTLERVLFDRIVGQLDREPSLVKEVMALWLMLEEIGYYDLIRMVQSCNNITIQALFDEALLCLVCIKPAATEPVESEDTTVFGSLFDEPMSKRFFYYNREFMYNRYMHIMETVCNKIFGDTSAIQVDTARVLPIVTPFGEGTSAQGAAEASETSAQVGTAQQSGGSSEAGETGAQGTMKPDQARQSILNPEVNEFVPGQTPEETRTMFLTFSNGYPLSREEIIQFFTSNWGDIVQDVYIDGTPPEVIPLFGRIRFTTSLVIPKILNGQSTAKFLVNGRHLRARIYVPRHSRRNHLEALR